MAAFRSSRTRVLPHSQSSTPLPAAGNNSHGSQVIPDIQTGSIAIGRILFARISAKGLREDRAAIRVHSIRHPARLVPP
jgi:hypothetical protein